MKNLLIVILLLSALIFPQQTFSQIPTNGLIGYWPFNGNANDASFNGNDGLVHGATLTMDRLGYPDQAYHFDGTNDLIQMLIGNLPTGNSPRSIFCWAKMDSLNNPWSEQTTLFHYGYVTTNQRSCILLWSGSPVFIGQTNDVCYGCNNSVSSNLPPNGVDGLWHHYGITYDSDTLKLYADGQLIAYRIINYNTQSNGTFKVGFSDSTHFNGEPFPGSIDDVILYDRELSATEVSQIYFGSSSPCQGSSLPTNLLSGLIAWYPFCGNADDESGNGNNGQAIGAMLSQDRFGNTNSAYAFNGTSDYISVQHSPTLSISDSITISCWVQANQVSTGVTQTLVSKGLQSVFWNYGISLNDLGYPVYTQTNFGAGPLSSLPDTNWHHIAITINQITNSMAVYVDGVNNAPLYNVNTNQIITNFSGFINSCCTEDLCFGKNAGGQAYFGGTLDDIAIWNRSLDSNEIRQLFLNGTNGITSPDLNVKVEVYPNPVNDKLYIQIDPSASRSNYNIKLLDPLGRMLYFSQIKQQELTIDIASVKANGLCVLVISDDDRNIIFTKKLIILKN